MTNATSLAAAARWIFAAASVSCVALLCFAYYMQYGLGHQPCPLCILQRYVYLAIAAVSLAGAAYGPKRFGAMITAAVLGVFAATGAALAIWQVTKGDTMTTCNTDMVGQIVYSLPMRAWWPEFLAAYGGCADLYPPILGLSIPLWSLIWFAGYLAIFAYLVAKLGSTAPQR